MSRTILVYAERRDGSLRRVAFEALGAARRLAGEGGSVHAVLAGSGGAAEDAAALQVRGADVVHIADDPTLRDYAPEAYLAVLRAAMDAVKPDALLLGHTAAGRELAPRVAAAYGAGHIADVTAIEPPADGADVGFIRPLYAGKAFERRSFLPGHPWVVTVRPNNLPPAEPLDAGGSGGAVQALPYAPPQLWTAVRGVLRRASGQLDLAEADVVVSGGRGVRSAAGFEPLHALAAAFGGAVGASRAACDAGYCDYALQIGQTGKVVTPQLYIACGISGAIQHLAGMSQSRTIVAINKDPDAPIFSIADYAIVGDLFEVVPLLTSEVLRANQQAD
ncbi:electron transfer flavoprotein subunit alpha/FixB family protein [Paenibacillus sp. 1011MAR3C5]|uniref:electron transfer flavoprotein subunit alpha/FixB family protein n=1 Tax=Paenibacillus sp. 1011MAR3C5 TaxID=1675787 RepID=UPI000E6CB0EA|nr:electron transfer flavoprotein subunit alpha/FixB family protein [Paenibacillus sp. 1011MAR3C5]RJE88288.1 electron transfer flavoprotein subunit alpha/FixB family protein [Paenibacillus sp. 1011MAR3C5]